MQALVSIHDVMPETLEHVQRILDRFDQFSIRKVALLVVPGKPWQPEEVDRVRQWQEQGYQIVAHGWVHHCATYGGLYHRVHSLLLSRDVAEHLSLRPQGRVDLLQRSHDWFVEKGLGSPKIYIPPAWALGRLPRGSEVDLPFRFCETLSGLADWRKGTFQRLPLVGYEADTSFRKWSLRTFNGWGQLSARLSNKPLRVSLHPYDLDYLLAEDIDRMLARVEPCAYPE